MNDRGLLELAAKAAGLEIHTEWQAQRDAILGRDVAGLWIRNGSTRWNPLTDDGDALRLAVKLRMEIDHNHPQDNDKWVMALRNGAMVGCTEEFEDESQCLSATRRAIVRAAAEIAQDMRAST
ncbi:MAG TPA: hypothetical protein VHQ92_10995 [Pseudolabrys sp.]|jgi:hypothetical protein|nr:hypothetical protein [Pseudolabrys sp.]